MHFLKHFRWQYLFLCIAAIMLTGCAVKRVRYDVPAVPLPGKYNKTPAPPFATDANNLPAFPATVDTNNPSGTPTTPLENVLPEWWRLLGSAELDALMDQALANNHDLHIATYRIAQTKARAEQAIADKIPVITTPLEARIEAPRFGIGTVPSGGDVASKRTYQASLRGDWRADIWGERQSLYESADLQLWRATFQRDDVQRSLIADVASSYAEYLSLNDRLRVAHESDAGLSEMLASVQARMEGGEATITELEQQRAAVYAVRATIPVMELQREQALNKIALLVGAVPGTLTLTERGLDSLAYPAVQPGVPSALLLRRPDVRVMESRLLAADADIDVARARVLPPLDLTAQIGYGTGILSQMFQPHTLFYKAIANLAVTVFDSGKRSREVDFTRAVHEEMVETYVRVIYGAVREVEDSLMLIQMTAKRLVAQQESVNAARRAWDFSKEAYSAGAIDYLTLLDTERTYHRGLDELLQIRMDRYRGMVELFLALGGGVQQGEPLPGKGQRPAPPSSGDSGTVSAAAPQPFDDPDFAAYQPDDKEEFWLAELPAVSDSVSVAATWRDLRERFPLLTDGRSLLPRLQGRVSDSDKERAAWYRLYVARFTASELAQEFCAELISRQMRCRAVSSRSKDFLGKYSIFATQEPEPAATSAPEAAPDSTSASIVADSTVSDPPPAEVIADPVPAVEVELAKPVSYSQIVGTPLAVPTPAVRTPVLGYAVQLGTYLDQPRAARGAATWQAKGYPAYVYKAVGKKDRVWYTVRLGNFPQRDSAIDLASEVSSKEGITVVPVTVQLDGDGNPNAVDPAVPRASESMD